MGHEIHTAPTIPLNIKHTQHAYLALIVPFDEGQLQIQAMENLYQACASDEPFAIELCGTTREQGFLLRASSEAQLHLLCKQIEAQYPQAEIQRVAPFADPLLLHAGEQAVVGEFALLAEAWKPIKTFPDKTLIQTGSDPLANILASMETVKKGERIICQIALVRAPDTWMAQDLRKSVEHPLQGERDAAMTIAKGGPGGSDIAEGLKLLGGFAVVGTGIIGYRWYQAHAWLPLVLLALGLLVAVILVFWLWQRHHRSEIYDMKLVSDKLMRQGFYSQLRVIVIGRMDTSSEQSLRTTLSNVETAYRQFTLASANGFTLHRTRIITTDHKRAENLNRVQHAFPYHHPLLRLLFGGWSPMVLNSTELAGLFHLPQETTDVPLVRRLSVKHLLFSPEISYEIAHTLATLPPVLIGHSKQRSRTIQVRLPFLTAFSHMLLIGRSRFGKSVLAQQLIEGAMQPVRDSSPQPGVFAIDPHHDLIEDILQLVPAQRKQDVLLLDMTDGQFPPAINPLDASMGFSRDQAIANLMSSFQRVWVDFWGPRMSYFLQNVCLLLYSLNERLIKAGHPEKQYTILDINPLLQYQDYAMQALSQLDMAETWHQELLSWWKNTYFTLPTNSSFRQEVILPIISKIGTFNDNQQLRRIVGQAVTRAPIHEAVTNGKIVLCALSSRDMDDASVNILGSTLINLLHRSFGLQQDLPLQERRRVFVAIDEFHAFSGSDLDRLLSEDAKYGASCLLATQNLKRLNKVRDGLLEMVLSNCQNLFVFNVSAADAKILEEELQAKVSQKHIISQPRLHCYARLAIQDHPLQIASVFLKAPASWQRTSNSMQQVAEIRALNQQRYAAVSDVDRRHEDHLKQFLDVSGYAVIIQREARKARLNKERREEARQREEDLRHDQAAMVTEEHTTDEDPPKKYASDKPRGLKTSPTPSADILEEEKKEQRRNHMRSRRKKKKRPIGVLPPDPQQGAELSQHPPSLPNHVSRGNEGRERERSR